MSHEEQEAERQRAEEAAREAEEEAAAARERAEARAKLQRQLERLQLYNRIVYHSLGALAVLAVDAEARAQHVQVC